MIELHIPREAVRIFEIFWCSIKKQAWTVGRCDTVASECCYAKTLVLLERTDVEWNLVVKEPDAAAYDSAIRISRRDDKTHTRREVAVVPDAVAIVTKSEIEHETRVYDPLVLHKG